MGGQAGGNKYKDGRLNVRPKKRNTTITAALIALRALRCHLRALAALRAAKPLIMTGSLISRLVSRDLHHWMLVAAKTTAGHESHDG